MAPVAPQAAVPTGQKSPYDSTRFVPHRGHQLPGEAQNPLHDLAVDPRRYERNTIDEKNWVSELDDAIKEAAGEIEEE